MRKSTPEPTPGTIKVAYLEGPPEVTFHGRTWRRGAPQTITLDAWQAMQKRDDFAGFGFQPITQEPAEAQAADVIAQE